MGAATRRGVHTPGRLKRFAKEVGAAPFRLLPGPLRRRLVQLVLHATVQQTPERAMRELLQIDTDVTGQTNEVALAYGGGVHVKHRLMKYHDFFVERIRSGERVLDVGCGYGAVAFSVASRSGAHVTGIDLEAENIRKARALFDHPLLSFIEGTAPRDLPPSMFDVVIASNVLEHVDRRLEFLRTIQRQVRPSRWLIRVPMFDREWRVPMRQELGLFHFGDPTHFIEYTQDSFEAEMREARFQVRAMRINWGEIWAEVAPSGVAESWAG